MSWAQELYNVYEQQYGVEHGDGTVLLPISHLTVNTQIEITLNKEGCLVSAKALTKEEGQNTIIPVTENSGGRTSNVCAMPLADKLIYLCGDYYIYTSRENSQHYEMYLDQLKKWHDSKYTHPVVDAVYNYISNGTLMNDLIDRGVIKLKESDGQIDEKVKIAGISQADAFVRFRVLGDIQETWLDRTLYDSFIEWYKSENKHVDLCYATCMIGPVTYNHPSKIRHPGDMTKLISANDKYGFTFRGRFADKTEAISVGYEFSQKMHNALRWLIQRQSINVPEEGRKKEFLQLKTMKLVVWTSSLQEPPEFLMDSAFDQDDEEYLDRSPEYDTEAFYCDLLRERIFGTQSFDINSKVMVMGLDASNDQDKGRLAIVMYDELERSCLMEMLYKWHKETSVLRFCSQDKISRLNSFSVREIIDCAYGVENSKGYLDTAPGIVEDNVLRLLPCITNGRCIPSDIVQNLVKKASNPLAYKKRFRNILETACGMIKKYNIDQGKGVVSMAYDPSVTERSYLFGCLLAIADAAEYSTYDDADKVKRATNARRYWKMFAARPSTTWKTIETQLRVYMMKLGVRCIRYEKMLNDIMSKFDMNDFMDNKPLSPSYLLGFHHYNAEIYKKKEEE